MGIYLGLDIGTSHITALALDADTGDIVATASLANHAPFGPPGHSTPGRSEHDAATMVGTALDCLAKVVSELPTLEDVAGIGVCGQMHGGCVIDAAGEPLTPFVGWQDQRGLEPVAEGGPSYVARASALTPGMGGAPPATGHMGMTLHWWSERGERFPQGSKAAFISDLLVSRLTGRGVSCDASNASSSGLYDLAAGAWNAELALKLGIQPSILPTIAPPLSIAGELVDEGLGLRPGIPVAVSVGDNQAAFAGSMLDPDGSVSLNIGTGGQLSVHTMRALAAPSLEPRPYMDGGLLLVGAELCGGRAYALLHELVEEIGKGIYGAIDARDLYQRLNELAAAAPPGSGGMVCEPLFDGSRHDPGATGAWRGITASNLTIGNLARSLLEGLIDTFAARYRAMRRLGVDARSSLVASGNALRRNGLLRELAGEAFDMRVVMPAHAEEAAYGAALVGAVASGGFASLSEAGQLIREIEVE